MEDDEELKFPREFDIDESNHAKFEDLKDSEIFKNESAPMKAIFIYSMVLGYCNKSRVPLTKRKGSIPSSTLNDEEEWLLKSIAVMEEKNLEILLNMKKVANIAEEYANGGIDLLYELVLSPHGGDSYRRLDAHVREFISNFSKLD